MLEGHEKRAHEKTATDRAQALMTPLTSIALTAKERVE
jgi:hypothetical protein